MASMAERIVEILKAAGDAGMSIDRLTEQLGCSEKQVRNGIDSARTAHGSTVLLNVGPRAFAYNGKSNWKTRYRSFYYQDAPDPDDPVLTPSETALLCIDVQNYGLAPKPIAVERQRWAPFMERMNNTVIPNLRALQRSFRTAGIDVIHVRIACLLEDGRDRSLSQKMPGWNNLLMPKTTEESQIIPPLAPQPGEIVVTKTTDSALTGTNLRLVLGNMGIRNVVVTGVYTDQCVSSTVRSLADESFNVVLVEDCCAAGTDELHERELEIINMLYCHVVNSNELREIMGLE